MLESDGYLLDPLQGVLQRPLRDAHLRRGPRRPAALRGGRPRRLGHLPGRRGRDRRAAPGGHGVPLQPGDPVLRPAPQHGGLLGDERQRRPRPRQQDLRQRARPPDRRRHRRRPPRLPGRLDARREEPHLLEQLQHLRGGLERRSRRSRSRSAPACGSPAATTTRSATTTSTTTGAAGRCSSACPTSSSAARRAGGNEQAGCDPDGQTTSFYNSQYDNHMGVRPDGTADPNGTDFWWDPYPGTTATAGGTTRPPQGADHHVGRRPALPDCDDGTRPGQERRHRQPRADGRAAAAASPRSRRATSTRTGRARGSRRRPSRSRAAARARRQTAIAPSSRRPAATVPRHVEGPLDRRARPQRRHVRRLERGRRRRPRLARRDGSRQFAGGVGGRRREDRRLRRHAHRPSRRTRLFDTLVPRRATRRASCSTSSTRTRPS